MTPHTTALPALRLINSRDRLGLTLREQQAVYLTTEGWNGYEIARELDLKESTLNKSLSRICQKLGVSNRVEPLFYVLSRRRGQLIPYVTNSQDEKRKSSEILDSHGLRLCT